MSDPLGLWTPASPGYTWQGDTLDDITQGYALFLEVCHPAHLEAFRNRLTADPDAARAEAAVFSWLRSVRLAPAINEDRSRGGMDFLCLPGAMDSFLMEVTSLRKDTVTAKSGWPDELTEEAAAFSMVTPQIGQATARLAHCSPNPSRISTLLGPALHVPPTHAQPARVCI